MSKGYHIYISTIDVIRIVWFENIKKSSGDCLMLFADMYWQFFKSASLSSRLNSYIVISDHMINVIQSILKPLLLLVLECFLNEQANFNKENF